MATGYQHSDSPKATTARQLQALVRQRAWSRTVKAVGPGRIREHDPTTCGSVADVNPPLLLQRPHEFRWDRVSIPAAALIVRGTKPPEGRCAGWGLRHDRNCAERESGDGG